MNIFNSIHAREVSSKKVGNFKASCSSFQLNNMSLSHHYDDPARFFSSSLTLSSPFSSLLMTPTKVSRIVPAGDDLVFILYQSGVCAAFNTHTKKMLCLMNVFPNTFIITHLYFNKYNNSVITVSTPNNSSLPAAVSINLAYVKRAQPEAGFPVFASDIQSGGFLECDALTGKAITCHHGMYKFYELKNYQLLYSVYDNNVYDIKTSRFNSVILISNKIKGHVAIKLISLEYNTVHQLDVPVQRRNNRIQITEQISQNQLLVKKERQALEVYDIQSKTIVQGGKIDMLPKGSGYYFLHTRKLLLTFTGQMVYLWSYSGELLNSFKDACWYRHHLPSSEEFYISYGNQVDYQGGVRATIYVYNVVTGKCLLKKSLIHGKIAAISYDEFLKELYIGNSVGQVHVFA